VRRQDLCVYLGFLAELTEANGHAAAEPGQEVSSLEDLGVYALSAGQYLNGVYVESHAEAVLPPQEADNVERGSAKDPSSMAMLAEPWAVTLILKVPELGVAPSEPVFLGERCGPFRQVVLSCELVSSWEPAVTHEWECFDETVVLRPCSSFLGCWAC